MNDNLFVRFTEENDSENGAWHFYIPIEGNTDALVDLEAACANSDCFYFSEEYYTVSEVDDLVENSDCGYVDVHNKLEGLLCLEDVDLSNIDVDLCNGQIADLME